MRRKGRNSSSTVKITGNESFKMFLELKYLSIYKANTGNIEIAWGFTKNDNPKKIDEKISFLLLRK